MHSLLILKYFLKQMAANALILNFVFLDHKQNNNVRSTVYTFYCILHTVTVPLTSGQTSERSKLPAQEESGLLEVLTTHALNRQKEVSVTHPLLAPQPRNVTKPG